jgi:hypothetical protein
MLATYFITDSEPLQKIGIHAPRRAYLVAEITNLDYPVRLYRTAGKKDVENYAVQYGQQVKFCLSRSEASHEFGQCVFHSAECAGMLGN